MKSTLSAALLLCLLASTSAVGCGDEAADSDGGGGHAGDHGEEADCTAISSVCHAVDELSPEAHDCHEVGHANVAEDCVAIKADCIALCSELAAGGAGGAGGSGH